MLYFYLVVYKLTAVGSSGSGNGIDSGNVICSGRDGSVANSNGIGSSIVAGVVAVGVKVNVEVAGVVVLLVAATVATAVATVMLVSECIVSDIGSINCGGSGSGSNNIHCSGSSSSSNYIDCGGSGCI